MAGVPAGGARMTGGPAVDMPTSTTFELPGYTVERTLGLSWGLIVRSVGLTKLNQTVERPDTPSTRGAVQKVPHLLRIIE